MKNDKDLFWMVVGPRRGGDVRHESLASAKAEAERLSQKETNEFYVLQTIGKAECLPAPVEWVEIGALNG